MSEKKEDNIQNRLFREKSLERISSPEDLNDYVRVANPGIWMLLIAIVILLLGFLAWAVFADLNTTVDALVVAENGHADCWVSEEEIAKVSKGMEVLCGEEIYVIREVGTDSFDARDFLSDYSMHVAGYEEGEWIHPLMLDNSELIPDGTYAADVIISTVKPISFILN